MLTFALLYLIHYILILFYFFILIVFLLNVTLSMSFSLVQIIHFIKEYTVFRPLIYLLFLSLAGFPPFFLFFFKIFILIEFCKYSIFYLQFLILLFLFISTIFYLQVFSTKNTYLKLSSAQITKLTKNSLYITNYSNLTYSYVYHFFFFYFLCF